MRTHTIGEVLNRLKDEFDDITISKIRFLESEGLISPDRTDSGYRKFTENDVERLRYVLRAQRDRYLPLKVIKEELDRIDAGLPVDDRPPTPPAEEVEAVRGDDRAAGAGPAPRSIFERSATDVSFSLTELSDASGVEPARLRDLQEHGLLRGDSSFDGSDLEVARIAGDLLDAGLEPRHLRMYRQFADREYALYEQLVMPLLRQRNPESRRQAAEHVDDLVDRGGRLHRALLARELRALLHS